MNSYNYSDISNILSGLLFFLAVGCTDSTQFTGKNNNLSLQPAGNWTQINDEQEVEDEFDQILSLTELSDLKGIGEPELLVKESGGLFSSGSEAGFFSIVIRSENLGGGEVSELELLNAIPQLWTVLKNAEGVKLIQAGELPLLRIKFKQDDLTCLLFAGFTESDGHILVFYAPSTEFKSKYERDFDKMAKSVSLSQAQNEN